MDQNEVSVTPGDYRVQSSIYGFKGNKDGQKTLQSWLIESPNGKLPMPVQLNPVSVMASRTRLYGIAICLLLMGCNRRGIVLELHSSMKPDTISFVVDEINGEAPQRTAGDTYIIQLSEDGVATVKSLQVLEHWHKEILVVNGRRITNFYLTNAKLTQAFTTTRLETGGTQRKSKEDGTMITYEVKYTGP